MSRGGARRPSTLGRYNQTPGDEDVVEVRLLDTPLQVFVAARDHHDALLREARLLALAEDGPPLPAGVARLVEVLGGQFAAAQPRGDEEVYRALAAGERTLDLVDLVPVSAAGRLERLRDLMAEADRLAERGLLLTVSRPPLVRRFGDWYFDQFGAQLAGGPPRRWEGPLEA